MRKKHRSEAVKTADIINSIAEVTKAKSISMDLVLETLKDALASAARKTLTEPANVEVKIDREKGTIEIYTRQTVVEEVEDPETQIHIDDAKDIDDELEVGDEVVQDLDFEDFGRTAVQTAKQVIIQGVREAEREKIYNDYSERIGELVTGTIQQIERGNILVNLGRTEALLPYKEQIRKEHHRQGENIRACISEVKHVSRGPQVIISRTTPMFLSRLFELEVPEIFDRTVRIVKVVRDPGNRSKIAVTTNDSRVDPVGACVGMRGNRVQAIVRELSNERIDIINWTDELSLLVRRVFAPAEVKRVIPIGDHKLLVVIKEEDLAQAIGREGQNIRLASKMLDKEIDVYGDEEYSSLTDEERANITGIHLPSEEDEDEETEDSDEEIEDSDEEIEDSDEETEDSDEETEDSDEEIEDSDEETEDSDEEIKSGDSVIESDVSEVGSEETEVEHNEIGDHSKEAAENEAVEEIEETESKANAAQITDTNESGETDKENQ